MTKCKNASCLFFSHAANVVTSNLKCQIIYKVISEFFHDFFVKINYCQTDFRYNKIPYCGCILGLVLEF